MRYRARRPTSPQFIASAIPGQHTQSSNALEMGKSLAPVSQLVRLLQEMCSAFTSGLVIILQLIYSGMFSINSKEVGLKSTYHIFNFLMIYLNAFCHLSSQNIVQQ